jgi:hypothetical protein
MGIVRLRGRKTYAFAGLAVAIMKYYCLYNRIDGIFIHEYASS